MLPCILRECHAAGFPEEVLCSAPCRFSEAVLHALDLEAFPYVLDAVLARGPPLVHRVHDIQERLQSGDETAIHKLRNGAALPRANGRLMNPACRVPLQETSLRRRWGGVFTPAPARVDLCASTHAATKDSSGVVDLHNHGPRI